MTNTYLTGNPLGSTSPKDLYDNASNMDEAMNSPSPSWTDRFSKRRETWTGLEKMFSDFIDASGYEFLGEYAAGITVSAQRQYFTRAGLNYRALGTTSLPYVLTGTWATDEPFFLAFDLIDTLRQELASNDLDKGAMLVSFDQFGIQPQGSDPIVAKGFWNDIGGGANILRLRDRMFIGAAAVNDGNLTNVVKDWLETERVSTTNNSNFAVLSTIGQTAGLFGSRTSDFSGAGSMGCIGVNTWAINDNTADIQTAYALYGESRRKAGAGTTQCFEFDIVNEGTVVDIQPYQPFITGATTNAWLASGGEVVGSAAASCALGVINNGAAYRKGIIFHATALDGCDGVTGAGIAMEMAKGHQLRQLFTGGVLGATLSFDVSNSAANQNMVFSDLGLLYRNALNYNLFQVGINSGYVNGVAITPGATGVGARISATGGDAAADLILAPHGAGSLNLDNMTVIGTAGAQAGYLNIKINGTPFKLAYFNV